MQSAHLAEVFSLALMTVGALVIQTCTHDALTLLTPPTILLVLSVLEYRTFYPVIKNRM